MPQGSRRKHVFGLAALLVAIMGMTGSEGVYAAEYGTGPCSHVSSLN